MLEGKNVNLKLVEMEDFPQLLEWFNDPEFWGPYNSLTQITKAEYEKGQESPRKPKDFFIQKKDGTRVGFVRHWDVVPNRPELDGIENGYALLPGERRKGYCQEAIDIILDFLFLSTTVYRIQALTDTMNVASQRVLERSGFQRGNAQRLLHAWQQDRLLPIQHPQRRMEMSESADHDKRLRLHRFGFLLIRFCAFSNKIRLPVFFIQRSE